jgi:hypothetical protein
VTWSEYQKNPDILWNGVNLKIVRYNHGLSLPVREYFGLVCAAPIVLPCCAEVAMFGIYS